MKLRLKMQLSELLCVQIRGWVWWASHTKRCIFFCTAVFINLLCLYLVRSYFFSWRRVECSALSSVPLVIVLSWNSALTMFDSFNVTPCSVEIKTILSGCTRGSRSWKGFFLCNIKFSHQYCVGSIIHFKTVLWTHLNHSVPNFSYLVPDIHKQNNECSSKHKLFEPRCWFCITVCGYPSRKWPFHVLILYIAATAQ